MDGSSFDFAPNLHRNAVPGREEVSLEVIQSRTLKSISDWGRYVAHQRQSDSPNTYFPVTVDCGIIG